MLYRMTIATSLTGHRASTHIRAARVRRPSLAPVPFVSVHLLDGGAPGGQLAGSVRHAIEALGALAPAQRLSLTAPADLPRLYTQLEADTLVAALAAAGAVVAVVAPRART